MKKDQIKSAKAPKVVKPKPLTKKQQKAADILALKAAAHEVEMMVAAEINSRLTRLEQSVGRIDALMTTKSDKWFQP